jgi:hypothetical protein
MIWTCFENEQREYPKKGFKHGSDRKTLKMDTEIEMRRTA